MATTLMNTIIKAFDFDVITLDERNALIKTLYDLQSDQEFLQCLVACGVDNWDGYSEARKMKEGEDQ